MSKSVLGKGLGDLLDQEKKPIGAHGLSGVRPGLQEPLASASNILSERQVEGSQPLPVLPLSLVSVILFSIDFFVCAVSWLLFSHSDLHPVAKNLLLTTGFSLGAASACLGVWLLNKKATAD